MSDRHQSAMKTQYCQPIRTGINKKKNYTTITKDWNNGRVILSESAKQLEPENSQEHGSGPTMTGA